MHRPFLLALLACVSAQAATRFEAPYTLEIETPHVPWAKPLPGGPIRLLAIPTVDEGRTVVELAQRLSLDLTTVTIDPMWNLNSRTMAFGKDFRKRAEKGDLRLIYSYLEEELTGPRPFDAVLLPVNHGWERLTPRAREALARRVREGCGLVLIRPVGGELAPLALEETVTLPADPSEPVEPRERESSPWRRAGDHYITRAIPIETFPFQYLENYVYRAAPGTQVLVENAAGHPILAEWKYGKGRVLAFAYRNAGLSWRMPMSARLARPEIYWEYFYSLLCRTLIYAAGRAPQQRPSWEAPAVRWQVRDVLGRVERLGAGAWPGPSGLAPGRHFLERRAEADWQISVVDVLQPDWVEEVRAAPDVIAEGTEVGVRWRASRKAHAELVDGFGRVIAQGEGDGSVTLKAGPSLTHSGVVRVTAGTASGQQEVRFAASSREWNDYEVIMPWYGPRSYQPWIPALDAQFRRAGVTTLSEPERNFKIVARTFLPVFGTMWYERGDYLKRKAEFARTGDKIFLTRDTSLQAPGLEADMRARLRRAFGPLAPLRPLAYYFADESSLTSYSDTYDVDWSPEALAGFRGWLRGQYGSLEALNTEWKTAFRNWDEVVPMTTEEAQRHGNYAPWSDHRAYMESAFVEMFAKVRAMVKEIDPGGLASMSGTQPPTAHNGCNWYEIDRRLDYIQPYSDGSQDAMHLGFNPGIPITGFTGYGLTGVALQQEQWQRLFYGHTGASIFWHYTMLNPDLSLSDQGKAFAEVFGRIQGGIGRMFLRSRVREDGVAIHFSMASTRGAWIRDGKISADWGDSQRTSRSFAELASRRTAWVRELERQGVQFRFLATPEIESGALTNYRVLILPYSIALTEAEAREIGRFLERGGTVYGDEETGRMDARCRWREAPSWTNAKGFLRRGPGPVGTPRALDVEGEFLVTVREFGRSRIIGLLPRINRDNVSDWLPGAAAGEQDTAARARVRSVRLPPTNAVRYDLLRGGPASSSVKTSPEEPILLLDRPTRIAALRLLADGQRRLALHLTDERGAGVDRSVVRLDVYDPQGRSVPYYGGTVDIVDGRGVFTVPFALNDASGQWRVHARDTASGLTVEERIRR